VDLAARLQQLEDLVKEAKSMPLSSSALVNRDEVLALIAEMRESLPEEIKQARWVVRDREELLAKARKEAEQIVADAEKEQLRIASEDAVVERARKEGERIVAEAEEEGRRIRGEAEDYVDAKLAQFEIALQRIQEEAQKTTKALARTLDQIEVGRDRLRGATPAEQEFAPPEPEPTEGEAGES
jgi:vacuolar-type H+-ATPase subunit H